MVHHGSADLTKYMGKEIKISLNADRIVVGTLCGYDNYMNLVVGDTVEVNGDAKTDIGMVMIRGNSVLTIELLRAAKKKRIESFIMWKSKS